MKAFTDWRISTRNAAFFGIILFLVIATINGALAYDNSNVIAAYSFDNDFTDGTNTYNLTNSGVVIDTTTYKLGIGSALFDTTDYLTADNMSLFDGTKNFSLSFWIRPDDTASEYWIWNPWSERNMRVRILSGGTLEFIYRISTVDYTVSTTVAGGTWYHIAITYSPTSGVTLYKDGASVDTSANVGTIDAITYNNAFGARGSDLAYNYHGRLDEFVIFTKVLSSSEVTALYNGDTYPYASSTSWSVHVTDLYDDSNLAGVNVTFATGCWNVTDATGTATVTNGACSGLSGTLSWSAEKSGYYDVSGTVVENSTTSAGMYQGVVNVTGIYRLVDNALLSASASWSVTTAGGKTYTGNTTDYPSNIYLANGSNTLTLKHSGAATTMIKHSR